MANNFMNPVSVPDYGELILNMVGKTQNLLTFIIKCFRPRLRGTNLKLHSKGAISGTSIRMVSVPDYGELILNSYISNPCVI